MLVASNKKGKGALVLPKLSWVLILLAATALIISSINAYAGQQIRIGALRHDISLFGSTRIESGTDLNLEWRGSKVPLPDSIQHWVAFRPFVGFSGRFSSHSTDEIYAGGAFDAFPDSPYVFNLGLGLAIHDGELHRGHKGRSALGQRVLFYASFELGRWWGHNGLFAFYQHSSNGFLPGPNEGINNLGLRYGYRF